MGQYHWSTYETIPMPMSKPIYHVSRGWAPKQFPVSCCLPCAVQNFPSIHMGIASVSNWVGLGVVLVLVRRPTYHLNATVPSEMKRDLHCLLIAHGKQMPSMCGTRQATGSTKGRLEIDLPAREHETRSVRQQDKERRARTGVTLNLGTAVCMSSLIRFTLRSSQAGCCPGGAVLHSINTSCNAVECTYRGQKNCSVKEVRAILLHAAVFILYTGTELLSLCCLRRLHNTGLHWIQVLTPFSGYYTCTRTTWYMYL